MNTLNIKYILLWGAIWGIIEATLGWILHFTHLPGKGIILFSIGIICMLNGVLKINKSSAAISIALVAALIKLINLVLPGPVLFGYYVVNPVVSILLEGLIITGFSSVFFLNKKRNSSLLEIFAGSFIFVFLHSVLFRIWQIFIQPFSFNNPMLQNNTIFEVILLFALNSMIIGAILSASIYLMKRKSPSGISFNLGWSSTLALLAASILLNVVL